MKKTILAVALLTTAFEPVYAACTRHDVVELYGEKCCATEKAIGCMNEIIEKTKKEDEKGVKKDKRYILKQSNSLYHFIQTHCGDFAKEYEIGVSPVISQLATTYSDRHDELPEETKKVCGKLKNTLKEHGVSFSSPKYNGDVVVILKK